jgi:hypothetical protein
MRRLLATMKDLNCLKLQDLYNYEELLRSTPEHGGLVVLKENVAYGPILK